MLKLGYLLYLAFLILTVVAKSPESAEHIRSLSNAQRIARRLPLRPPKFGRFLPGSATPVLAARTGSPSIVPVVNAKIKVTRADNGNLVGYISKTYSNPAQNYNWFGVTSSIANALQVSFTPATGSGPIEITQLNGPDSSYHFLGAVPGNSGSNLSASNGNRIFVTSSSHTAAGSPPTGAGASNAFNSGTASESTIWFYDTTSQSLTAVWHNTDGSPTTTNLLYQPSLGALELSGTQPSPTNTNLYQVVYTVVF
ncbi:hypothetical protein CPB83DRAFT_859811 [Crepidotus variabilis]|uniref:Uncharacterized protein n=1 Tax=Crepidotus variabilis TaxID=179855 RepID=A0A9P6EA35_9AGAR|nr:hypothetical protein CPB83DRAFT_859811 [Crepidotus variabilis]